ncbi:hypothetical protein MC378_15245 [Polaribacter sp. MSW13]|uniref:Uncharacterized protein n=1 Tax=Polaribacter marinus TaxID=2916838 RepID=A0A9X1VTF3_9FLAO|nr:hypothetical protein [Polaribacter marinus]MCI2230530.1 hypothetical protein [Polaribacter marinus]
MKTKNYKLSKLLKAGILFFGVSLLFSNCENDGLVTPNKIEVSTKEKQIINLKTGLKNKLVNYNKNLRSKNSSNFKSKFGVIKNKAFLIDFEENNSQIIITPIIGSENKLLISYKKEGVNKYKIFKKSDFKENIDFGIESFIVKNLSVFFKIIYNEKITQKNTFARSSGCMSFEQNEINSCFIGVFNHCTNELYFIDTCGKMEEDEEENWEWGDENTGDNGWNGEEDGQGNETGDEDWEWNEGGGTDDDQIINNLTGKADCTYQKLQSNSLLKNTLKKFVGENTPVNLIINQKSNLREDDDDNTSELVNGKTYYGNSYNITVSLNTEQSINRPSLAVARTILHEAIHADIYRKIKTTSGIYLDSSTGKWRLPDGSRAHFPTLFDNFNEDPNNPHHNYMANYYRTAMEDGLKEFATSIGETHTDQFYKDFVWSGLLETKAWENQYSDPTYANSEKIRIKNVIINYENSTNNECQ